MAVKATQVSTNSKSWEDKISNLNTSDKEVRDLIEKVMSDKNVSPADTNILQYTLSRRMNNASLISNLIKTITESSRAIINNFRP
jgi:replication initiation and membrane attachment protein DnaB